MSSMSGPICLGADVATSVGSEEQKCKVGLVCVCDVCDSCKSGPLSSQSLAHRSGQKTLNGREEIHGKISGLRSVLS